MKVDCHIHSLCSDGVYTIKEMIPILLKNEIEVFSVTDHDTIDGIKEARIYSANKLRFIPGIEFTCKEIRIDNISKEFSIHLLGYNFDENHEKLLETLETRKENVREVFENLCNELTERGYSISRAKIPISCGNVMQLCDVTEYIRRKYPSASKDIFELIESYSTKLNAVNISVEKAIELIHSAGGKAIWAHPFCVYKNFRKIGINREEVERTLDVLKKMGIDGLEAYYRAFSEEEQTWLYETARNNQMLYTAGSDFHGSPGRSTIGVII